MKDQEGVVCASMLAIVFAMSCAAHVVVVVSSEVPSRCLGGSSGGASISCCSVTGGVIRSRAAATGASDVLPSTHKPSEPRDCVD